MTNPLTANTDEQIFLKSGIEYRFDVSGTFGSGTISLEYEDSGGTRRTVDGTDFTSEGTTVFVAPKAKTYLVLTGATTPSLSFNLTQLK